MDKLRELRKSKSMSMKKFGQAIGVAESTISLYETGKRQPDIDTLKKIAIYFNVSIDYLVGFSNDNENININLSYEKNQLLQIYSLLTEKNKSALLERGCALLEFQGSEVQPKKGTA